MNSGNLAFQENFRKLRVGVKLLLGYLNKSNKKKSSLRKKDINSTIKVSSALMKEAKDEAIHMTELKYTQQHYKEYIQVCRKQINSCINYCSRGHLFKRKVESNNVLEWGLTLKLLYNISINI